MINIDNVLQMIRKANDHALVHAQQLPYGWNISHHPNDNYKITFSR